MYVYVYMLLMFVNHLKSFLKGRYDNEIKIQCRYFNLEMDICGLISRCLRPVIPCFK